MGISDGSSRSQLTGFLGIASTLTIPPVIRLNGANFLLVVSRMSAKRGEITASMPGMPVLLPLLLLVLFFEPVGTI